MLPHQSRSGVGNESGTHNSQNSLLQNDTDRHLVVYRGADIVGALHLDLSEKGQAYVRSCNIEDQSPDRSVTVQLMKLIETWVASQGRQLTYS